MNLSNIVSLGLFLLLFFALSQRFSWFVPEVAVAATCDSVGNFESGEEKVHILELYTSEGCSSCPPAEKWLNSLYNHPLLYKSFIPLAFHVDYWNYLGHPDPYSKGQYSKRQRTYASEWKSGTVYTPGFIKDGREWRSFSRSAPSKSGEKVGNLKVQSMKGNKFKVTFAGTGAAYVYGAFLLHGLENKIKRGENRGKTLVHSFVVGDLQKKALKDGMASIELTDPKLGQKDQSVVFWVTSKTSQAPVQAAGHCLKM